MPFQLQVFYNLCPDFKISHSSSIGMYNNLELCNKYCNTLEHYVNKCVVKGCEVDLTFRHS